MTDQTPTQPSPPDTPGAATTVKPADAVTDLKVIIRPWPKVVFLYPTLLAAFVCWLWLMIGGEPKLVEGSDGALVREPSDLGNWFMVVFFLNLLVFSFDFSRIKSITIVVAIIALGFGVAWANSKWEVVTDIESLIGRIDMQMNAQFYGWVAAFLFVCFLMVLINTRFNYYEINHREILHHHGYLGDVTRVPTHGLRLNKEIYDLVEYALLRSGRLIFVTPTAHEAIVVDNVISVNKVEDQLKELLSVMAVRMR